MTQNEQNTSRTYCENIFDLVGKDAIPGIKAMALTWKDFNTRSNPERHAAEKALPYQRHNNNPNIFREITVNKAKGITVTIIDIERNQRAIFPNSRPASIDYLEQVFKESFLLAGGLDANGQPIPEPA